MVNIDGVKPGSLTLDGKTLADIYIGKITTWDDPAIRTLNPRLQLPNLAISIVHRSDASGTTFNFTDYLSKLSQDWKASVGEGTSIAWPAGVGGKGNAGVASYVQQTKGAIGYVEYAYAVQNHLAYAAMINAAGKKVAPTMSAFQASANADFSNTENFYLILTDQPGAKSWPITAATYMLMRKDAPPADNLAVLNFLDWALRVRGAPV